MALIVQKYGGTSVGDIKCINVVVERIIKTRQLGHKLVVVVSAMAGETDRLVQLASELSFIPNPREFDILLSTGEQVTMSLLSIALLERGCPVRSYTGWQGCIKTNSVHNKARILDIDTSNIEADLLMEKIVVVAGFQGMSGAGNITTLGRGGSDTTAVALAAALKADECQIYTDVDGVYTVDPKIVKDAHRILKITANEMLEMASNGAKVIHNHAVEFANRYNVPVRVLSTFHDGPGTLIIKQEENIQQHSVVSGIVFNRNEVKFFIDNISETHGNVANILGFISQSHIEIDMIVQSVIREGASSFIFTIHKRDLNLTLSLLEKIVNEIGTKQITYDEHVAKISLVGLGIRSHADVIGRMFQTLSKEGISVQLTSISELKISVIVNEKDLEIGVRALHDAFFKHLSST